MADPIDAALANPWAALGAVIEGPLHPGGDEATARLLDRAEVGAGTRLLEVGCGAGGALRAARERGAEAVGLDRSPGTERALRGDARALPVRAERVDVVLAECVLCLTDLPAALAEARRVLVPGGRLALSDVVVEGRAPAIPDHLARALCLDGAGSRDRLERRLVEAGFEVRTVEDRREDLLAMRDRVTDRIDYEGLLGAMGERGRRGLEAIEAVEAAVEDGRVGYVSVLAARRDAGPP